MPITSSLLHLNISIAQPSQQSVTLFFDSTYTLIINKHMQHQFNTRMRRQPVR